MQHAIVPLTIASMLLTLLGSSWALSTVVTTRQATSSAPLTTNAPATPPAPAIVVPAPKPAGTITERLRSTNNAVVQAALDDALVDDKVPTALLPEFDRILRQHPAVEVRVAAIEAVGMADANSREPLLLALGTCLQHPNEDVRSAAMDVIADTPSKVAIDLLVAQRGSTFADVRDGAQDNLETITEKEFTKQAQWRAWWTTARPTFTFD
ncbi:MAG: HEAT repeat domain-containing protein [bacterium]|nr:HEAT repeat domain-containing protein [bacterium]